MPTRVRMEIPKGFLEAKDLMSRQWLGKSLQGGAVRRAWALTLSAALEGAPTNVHAVGIGHKRVAAELTQEFAIRFYVVHKIARSILPDAARLPDSVSGLPTDVIETPPAALTRPKKRQERAQPATVPSCAEDRRKLQRPLVAGISVGHFKVTAGTLACFCRSTRTGDDRSLTYALSNNHVFANINEAAKGDDIYQPGRADGGTSANRVAVLERFVPLGLGGTSSNRVDAALAALLPNVGYTADVCSIGRVLGTSSPEEGMSVCKHGRTTGYTEGEITDVAYDALVGMDGADSAKFENQIRIERSPSYGSFAEGGDSGSLVLQKDTRKAVGLYFAGPPSGGYGVANPISAVLRELEIELV